MKKTVFQVFVFLAFALYVYAQEGWYWSQPMPQGNDLFDVEIVNGNSVVAAGEYGTIMRTTDGVQWDVQHRVANSMDPIYSVDFTDALTGWAVGGNYSSGLLIKTEDGGETWQRVQTFNGTTEKLFFADADHGCIIGDDWDPIVFYTHNGGENWNRVDLAYDGDLNDVWFSNADKGWIGGGSWSAGYLLQSTDGGMTWDMKVDGLDNEVNTIFFLNDNLGWFAGGDGMVYKTTDGGDEWKQVASGDIYDYQDICFADENHGWAASDYGFLYFTTDGGSTWNRIEEDGDLDFNGVTFSDPDNGWVVGDGGRILHTINGGDTWDVMAGGQSSWLKTAWFFDDNTGLIGGTETGTIRKTTDGGQSWETVYDTEWWTSNELYFLNNHIGYCAGAQFAVADILRTTDGGDSWNPVGLTDLGNLSSVYFFDEYLGWAVGHDGMIIRTVNGGNNWTTVMSGNSNLEWTAVWFRDNDVGFAAGIDYGNNFSGILYRSEDSGQSFEPFQNTGDFNDISDLFGLNSTHCWMAGADGLLKATTDGGDTWNDLSDNTLGSIEGVHFIDENLGYLVNFDGEIFHSTDGGTSWIKQVSNCGVPLLDISFPPVEEGVSEPGDVTTGYAVGWRDIVLKTTTGGIDTGVEIGDLPGRSKPESPILIQNYPNPFNAATTIGFYTTENGPVIICVFNILGQQTGVLLNEIREAGYHEIVWNAGDLPGGIYLVQLKTRNLTAVQKMILQK